MPGRLLRLTPRQAVGWAAHPRLADYPVLVHLLHRSVIVRSVLAESALPAELTEGTAIGCGFSIDLSWLRLGPDDIGKLRFSIGETDERLDLPPGLRTRGPSGLVTVEEILADAHRPRAWVNGTTYRDAAAAGLRPETIIDLLYRDYLGRAADGHGLAHYAETILGGTATYDDMRRGFVGSDEYRLRRKYADRAPGSIFSQALVMAVAGTDAGREDGTVTAGQTVVASDLARLDGRAFVTEVYRRILLKEPDEAGMAHYLHQLHLGVGKMAIIRHIAAELEAITAGVQVIGMTDDTMGEAASFAGQDPVL